MKTDFEVSPFGERLIYKKIYTPEIVYKIIKENNLKGLKVASHLKEDRLYSLDFLREYSFLEALDISVIDDFDYEFLSALPNLKELSISGEGKKEIRFDNLQDLNKLTIQWRKGKIKGLINCQSLKKLCLVNFNEHDLITIRQLSNLTELYIKTSSINTLSGIENLKLLEFIQIGNCKKLYSIDSLNGLQLLKTLEILSCPNINDYGKIKYLPCIERLELTDCNGIKSIKFIENLLSLKKLVILGNTNILEGNMLPAQRVSEKSYRHRPHYNI